MCVCVCVCVCVLFPHAAFSQAADDKAKRDAARASALKSREACLNFYHDGLARLSQSADLSKLNITHIKAILRVQYHDTAKGAKGKDALVQLLSDKAAVSPICMNSATHTLPPIEDNPVVGQEDEEDEEEGEDAEL